VQRKNYDKKLIYGERHAHLQKLSVPPISSHGVCIPPDLYDPSNWIGRTITSIRERDPDFVVIFEMGEGVYRALFSEVFSQAVKKEIEFLQKMRLRLFEKDYGQDNDPDFIFFWKRVISEFTLLKEHVRHSSLLNSKNTPHSLSPQGKNIFSLSPEFRKLFPFPREYMSPSSELGEKINSFIFQLSSFEKERKKIEHFLNNTTCTAIPRSSIRKKKKGDREGKRHSDRRKTEKQKWRSEHELECPS